MDRPRDLVSGLMEAGHATGNTRRAYDAIYSRGALMNLRHHSRWMLKTIGAEPGMRLLDVACGEAGLVSSAAGLGLDALGIDQSLVALRHGQPGLAPTRLIAADGEALPFADNSFDRVVNVGSLEHYIDPVRGAAEMARVLAPDGLAGLLLPNAFGLRTNVLWAWRRGEAYDDGQPLQRYGTRVQWTRLLEAGGFRVEQVLGYESRGEMKSSPAGLLSVARHPTRLFVLFARWMPVDMAAMQVFLCRKASTHARVQAA